MNGLVINSLSQMNQNDFLSSASLADALHICPRTLRRMVLRYELPEGIRQGKHKFWRVGLLLQWFRKREQENLQAAERELERIRDYEGRR